jgi:hypothetical protein
MKRTKFLLVLGILLIGPPVCNFAFAQTAARHERAFDYRVPGPESMAGVLLEMPDSLMTYRKKSPVLACLLSIFPPGLCLGQHYNGEHTKGFLLLALYATGSVMLYANEPESTSIEDFLVGLGLISGSWLWSVIDAPVSAARINREAVRKYGHLFELQRKQYSLGLDLAPTMQKDLTAKLTLHF